MMGAMNERLVMFMGFVKIKRQTTAHFAWFHGSPIDQIETSNQATAYYRVYFSLDLAFSDLTFDVVLLS